MSARAQSSSVGVILLTFVVVVVVGGGGYVVLDGGGQSQERVLLSVQHNITSDQVSLTHVGGDSLPASEIRVVVRGGVAEQTFTVDPANLSGGDTQFDPSEQIQRQIQPVGSAVDLYVVHAPTETVLLTVSERLSTTVLEWASRLAWDGASRSVSVVHDDFGDHRAETVELGHARDSTGLVSYWPLDGGGAGTATDVAGSNPGTVTGPTTGVDGVFNTTAYGFDGDDTVRVPDSASLDDPASTDAVTIGGWVNTTEDTGTVPIWSRYDGVGPASDDDLTLALRDGRVGTLLGQDGIVGVNVTRDSDDWAAGTGTNTTVTADGNLTLDTRRGVAHGQFGVPDSAGQQTISTEFEPDLITFRTVVTGTGFGETTDVGPQAIGTGYGFADCTGSSCTEVAQSAGSGSGSPNAQVARSTDSYSVYQVLTDENGDDYLGTVEGRVVSTSETGFTLDYDGVVSSGPEVLVAYSAYQFESGTEVDVGSFQTPTAGTTGSQSIATGFEPSSVRTITGPEIQSQNYARPPNATEYGWSRGWAIDNESRSLTTDTTTIGETGRVTVSGSDWTTISFSNSYTDPVVVGTTNTVTGESPLVFDARSVTSTSAEIRLCESEGGAGAGCDSHGQETVGYLVVDAAETDSVDGIAAGRRTVSAEFSTTTFTESLSGFSATPAVLADTQNVSGSQPVDARVVDSSTSGFEAGICYQDTTDGCSTHSPVEVGWVALTDGVAFDQQVSVGTVTTDNSEWVSASYPSYSSTPVVVASTQTENGEQELQTDEVRNVGTTSAEVRYCEVDDGDSCDTHTTETVAYVTAPANTSLTISTQTRHEQVVLSHAAYAENIDDHVYAANDRQLIHTLWTNKGEIDGRVTAYLESFDDTGFTINYTENDPDAADGSQYLVTYLAVNSTAQPELGHDRTPTTTGEVTYETTGRPSAVTLTGHNAIPEMDIERYSGANAPENHLGWTTGGGVTNATGRSLGFSSHSDSVNANAVGSRQTAFHLVYANHNGGVLGTDTAAFAGSTADSFSLDWTSTVTSSTPTVQFDRTVFVWHSYGGVTGYETRGEWEAGPITTNDPVVWNETDLTATLPSGTGVDVNYTDGSDWYDTIAAVPRTDSISYNVTLTGTPTRRPEIERVRTEYVGLAAEQRWTTDTQREWQTGTFGDTRASGGTLELRDNAIGESGRVTTANGAWQTIAFDDGYTDPVVVGTTNTHNGPAALTVDVRNVDAAAGSAEIRLCESEGYTTDGCDGSHGTETVGYIVVDAATLGSVEGIEAGTIRQDSGFDTARQTVAYDGSYSTDPVVLATVQSVEGDQPVEARVLSRTARNFTTGICHTGSLDGCDSSHTDVTVGWVALEPGNLPFVNDSEVGRTGNVVADSDWTGYTFSTGFAAQPVVVAETQTDDGGEELQITEARAVTSSGVEVRYCEIETGDSCDSHTTEDVALLAIEVGPLVVDTATTGTYRRQLDAGRVVDWSTVSVTQTTPLGTAVDVNYSDGSGWYDTLASVPNSSTLSYNVTLTGTLTDSPSVSTVTVDYIATGWRTGSTTVADGTWHHVLATYDGTDLRLYVDGQLDHTAPVDVDLRPASTDATLGGEPTLGSYLTGRLDAVRLSDRALSAGTVENRYNTTRNGTVVTASQSFNGPVDPSGLSVTVADTSVPPGTSVTLLVESDPDGDGVFEARSDPIDASGTAPYDVTGLTGQSMTYRVVARFGSTDRTTSPILRAVRLEHSA